MKKIIIAACLLWVSALSFAQSGTNSPYSQLGLGLLSDQSTGFNRAMSGLGYGFHEHNQVNVKNPASYSALDSLTFILDAAVGLQVTNFNENGNHSQFNHTVDVGNIEEYHVYSLLWDEDSITFSVDGKKHLSRNKSAWNKDYEGSNAPFNSDFYLILNMAVGGLFDNHIVPPDDWESSDMLVDYVRIYKATG